MLRGSSTYWRLVGIMRVYIYIIRQYSLPNIFSLLNPSESSGGGLLSFCASAPGSACGRIVAAGGCCICVRLRFLFTLQEQKMVVLVKLICTIVMTN